MPTLNKFMILASHLPCWMFEVHARSRSHAIGQHHCEDLPQVKQSFTRHNRQFLPKQNL